MKQKIIVIGAGFAGIQFVRKLDERFFDILLIDKINHHQFQPLFYQVATSQIEPSSISFPIRHIFKNKKNVRIRLAELKSIDAPNRKITTSIGDFDYDYLVIATGCKTNFFGNSEIQKHAFSLKSTYNSITIRNHILQIFERILSAPENEKEGLFNLVIVGAGPTGVELAGAFAEIKKNILPKDYPRIDFSQFKIILIEGSKFTLNNMSDHAKTASKKYLKKMGATILTEVFVKNYDGHLLTLSNGTMLKTETVIWAAGVIGSVIPGIPTEHIAHGNRIIVDRMNKSLFNDSVFALGDISYMETPKYPHGHPQVANVAINQAINLAKNLNRQKKGRATYQFEYKDWGSMATIGRNKAVVDFPFVRFKGYFAWLIWMFLHLMLILSVRNKLIIFINWAMEYVTKDTSLRLILTPEESKE
ncbi:MAG: NAD(P)/FAD-dependent oxidoreductase [Bacteroidales bacterium]|nr:NAD(P)/FAD-dependent oxidoreductase [Bacteroidales bacterium]